MKFFGAVPTVSLTNSAQREGIRHSCFAPGSPIGRRASSRRRTSSRSLRGRGACGRPSRTASRKRSRRCTVCGSGGRRAVRDSASCLVPNFAAGDAGLRHQFVVAADGFHLAGRLAFPDRQRRAPVAFAAERPVDVRFEELAEAAVFDVLGQPVDLRVVREHVVFELRRADEPALARILDEGVLFGARAEGVVVDVLFLVEQEAALLSDRG